MSFIREEPNYIIENKLTSHPVVGIYLDTISKKTGEIWNCAERLDYSCFGFDFSYTIFRNGIKIKDKMTTFQTIDYLISIIRGLENAERTSTES